MSADAQAKSLILVYSDDVDFFLFMDHAFQAAGFETHLAGGLQEVRQFAVEQDPDAILLDCRAPETSAIEVCGTLKQDTQINGVPIVTLINQGAERDCVQLIKSGIDETFVSPIWPAKLIERMRAVLNPSRSQEGSSDLQGSAVRYADVEMDLARYRVRRAKRAVHLSPTEFKLLRHFLEHPEQVVTREELHNAAWQDNIHVGPRTVDVHVGRLRKALRTGSGEDLIRTVRSVGYALSVHPPTGS